MTRSLAARERLALCGLATQVGPDAPTLCEGWTVRDLLVHLVLRDRPWLMVRRPSPPVAEQPFEWLVDQVRTPPKPFALGPVEKAMNTVEFFVHHEDVRRARPGWEPRELSPDDQLALGAQLGRLGRVLGVKASVPLVVDDGTRARTLRPGSSPVTVAGPAAEIVLFLFGRREVRGLSFEGPPERVEALRTAKLGF